MTVSHSTITNNNKTKVEGVKWLKLILAIFAGLAYFVLMVVDMVFFNRYNNLVDIDGMHGTSKSIDDIDNKFMYGTSIFLLVYYGLSLIVYVALLLKASNNRSHKNKYVTIVVLCTMFLFQFSFGNAWKISMIYFMLNKTDEDMTFPEANMIYTNVSWVFIFCTVLFYTNSCSDKNLKFCRTGGVCKSNIDNETTGQPRKCCDKIDKSNIIMIVFSAITVPFEIAAVLISTLMCGQYIINNSYLYNDSLVPQYLLDIGITLCFLIGGFPIWLLIYFFAIIRCNCTYSCNCPKNNTCCKSKSVYKFFCQSRHDIIKYGFSILAALIVIWRAIVLYYLFPLYDETNKSFTQFTYLLGSLIMDVTFYMIVLYFMLHNSCVKLHEPTGITTDNIQIQV
jgi:hypothetical protein